MSNAVIIKEVAFTKLTLILTKDIVYKAWLRYHDYGYDSPIFTFTDEANANCFFDRLVNIYTSVPDL